MSLPEVRHEFCTKECQQARDYGVWPEHSCKPVCVYLNNVEHLQDGQKLDVGGLAPNTSYTINSAKTVTVANDVYLEKCDKNTPRGVKLQLLTVGGILVYGYYHGESWITHWAPCPRRRD